MSDHTTTITMHKTAIKTGQRSRGGRGVSARVGGKAPRAALQRTKEIVPRATYEALYAGLEEMRDSKGAFVASLSEDYDACWIRDQLYANFAYLYTGEEKKFVEGVRAVFDILHKQYDKIEFRTCYPPNSGHEHIHAKYHVEDYEEVTPDWGHHQVDAIGLFLYMVALADERRLSLALSTRDRELLQLLVSYLTSVRFWEKPDNGMWEEWMELHASSIGAAVKGLALVKQQALAHVPNALIHFGLEALYGILPNETPGREQDLAQLSLVFPYKLLPRELEDEIVYRITTRLVQPLGVNRYLDDNYYRSANGVSGEWTFGFFWLSIVACERGDRETAHYWLERGLDTITEAGELPELYQDGRPNINTPLAWSHAMALIAIHTLAEAS